MRSCHVSPSRNEVERSMARTPHQAIMNMCKSAIQDVHIYVHVDIRTLASVPWWTVLGIHSKHAVMTKVV